MNSIDFIPLIETATRLSAESESSTQRNSFISESKTSEVYRYRLFDLDNEDLERAIDFHIADMDIIESCSLFGGYALSINGRIELYPQCCGLLEEIQDWKNILNEDFEDFYLKECHPSPLVTKRNEMLIVLCKDGYETFFPSTTAEEIRMDYLEAKYALLKLLDKLTNFSTKLDLLSNKYGADKISNILIWGNSESS